MRSFTILEILSEFHGMKDVIKKTFKDGNVIYHTREYPFSYEVTKIGACKLNFVDNEFGHFMHFFNTNNETVGVYKMTSRLRGFTKEQLAEQHSKLFFCKMFNPDKGIWEIYVDGTPAKVSSYKEGCGLVTILNEGHYYVVDKDNNYIVQPGKYDFIDGFDKCGLARVKIDGKADIFNPEKTTYDRWGVIDTKGEEILPLEYSEIWSFYNKNRKTTTVWKGDMLTDLEDSNLVDYYQARVYKYDFDLYTHNLFLKEEWSEGNYNCMDSNYYRNQNEEYTIWDALDGELEAAGNIDYVW